MDLLSLTPLSLYDLRIFMAKLLYRQKVIRYYFDGKFETNSFAEVNL